MNLAMDASDYPIEIMRTKRIKTASIEIVEGKIHVIVPENLSEEKIQQMLREKQRWIREKLRIQSQIVSVKPKEYVSGESFAYLGKNYRLKLLASPTDAVRLIGGRFVLGVDKSQSKGQQDRFIKNQLMQWYWSHAEKRLQEKTKRYSKLLGVEPKSVSVKEYKSRWGSCSIKGDISYNWKIIIAPHHIVDYVVVHELCHMLEHNHSPAYWKHVNGVISDNEECRMWLKVNGSGLVV